MASEPTELLPPAAPLDGNELVHVVQAGNSRQTTLAAMLVGALMSWIPAPGLAAINLQTSLRLGLPTMPDHFAAVGDGVADDYQPFQDLAAYISGNGGGRVALRQGATYLLNRNIAAGNGVVDVIFLACKSLTIEGNGSKIKLKGGWDRDLTTKRSFMPLRFDQCSNVTVRNIEIDGSVDTITNSVGNATGLNSFGIGLFGCNKVLLENVYSHHHMLDGIYLGSNATLVGGKFVANKNVVLRNCVSKFNVRLGLGLIQVRGFVAENCDFSFTAFNNEAGTPITFTNGGGPRAGVDIEPNLNLGSATPIDVQTGDITFRDCRMKGNASSSFLAVHMVAGAHDIDQIHLDGCDIDHVDGQIAAGTGFALDAPDSSVTNCRIDARDSCIFFPYNAASLARQRFTGNKVYGRMATANGSFLGTQSTAGNSIISENEFICTSVAPAANGSRFFRNTNTNSDVLSNRFFLPAAGYADFTATDVMLAITVDGKRAEGNRYETDLLAAAGGSGTACYGVAFGDLTIARGERFVGKAVGWADTIQPMRRTAATQIAWDTTALFESNKRMARVTAFDPASTALGSSSALQNLAVLDAAIGDKVDVAFLGDQLGMTFRGYVSAADTVKWFYRNDAGANPLDLAANDVIATVTRRSL